MTVDIYGFAFNLAGTAVDGAVAQMFTRNTSTQIGDNYITGTASDGEFTWSGVAEGLYDIKVTSGSSVRWRKYDDEIQVAVLEAGSLRLRGTNAAFTHVFQGTPTATRTITFPDKAGTVAMIADVTAAVAAEDTIAELNDTNIGSLAAGHILVYDNTASVWDNVALSGGTGLTATLGDGTLALAIDSTVATLTGSQTLTYKTLTAPAINGVVGGTQTSATITALTLTSMAQNWTNASRTVADMGIVTTIDINGGTIDGTTVGATGHSTIKGTSIDATDDFTIGATVITDGVITDASGLSLAADVTVTGDLTVSGDTITVNTSTLTVEDPLIALASENAGADTFDIGFYGLYDTSGSQDLYAGLFRDANDSGKWKLFKDNQAAPSATAVNTGGTGYAVGTLVATLEGNVTGNVTGNVSGTAPAGSLTGTSLNSTVVTSSLTTVATIGTGVWAATDVAVAHGGTGASTATAGFDALSPMTAEGDVLYGGSSGTVTKLAKGSDADVLTLASGVPSWVTPTTGDITGITTGDGLSGGATSGTPTLVVDLVSNGGLEISSGELQVATGIAQHDIAQYAASVEDNDFLRIDGTKVEGLSVSEVAAAIEASIDAVGTIASGTWAATDVGVGHGGTGVSTHTNHGVLLGQAGADIVATDAGTSGEVLISGGSGADPDWGAAPAASGAQTGITTILNVGAKLGRDSQNLIDFATTDDKIILRVANVDEVELVANVLQPTSNDGVALGTTSLGWSDLHLATAGVINWANSEMTITEGADVLTVAGGTFATAALTATTFAPTDDITLAADKSLNLPQGANVKFTDQITQDSIDDRDAQGIIFTFQAGMTVTPFSPVYLGTDDEVHECDADAIATMPCIGVSINTSNVADGAAIEVMVLGLIRDESFTDFGTNGAPLYVSTTVGVMSNTAPSGTDDVVQVVGHSIGEKLIFVQPCLTTIEHA